MADGWFICARKRSENPPIRDFTSVFLWWLTCSGSALNKNYVWCWVMQCDRASSMTSRNGIFPGSVTKRGSQLEAFRKKTNLHGLFFSHFKVSLWDVGLKIIMITLTAFIWMSYCGINPPAYLQRHMFHYNLLMSTYILQQTQHSRLLLLQKPYFFAAAAVVQVPTLYLS